MFNNFVLVAFIINILVFLFVMLKSFSERGNYKKVNEALMKKTEENIDKSKSLPEKIGVAIGVIIFGLILIGIALLPFIMLVAKWVQESFIVGFRYFLIYSLLWPLFTATVRTINKNKTIINEKHRLTIFMFLSGVFISIIYTKFGIKFDLFEIIEYYSASDYYFSTTLTVVIPGLVIISTVLTYYSAVSKMSLLKIESNNYPHWTTKYPFVLTIVVFSIYAAILYISELSLEQKTEINYSNMTDTINVIQNVLGAALIPLIIGIFFNVSSELKSNANLQNNECSKENTNIKESEDEIS